MVITEHSPLSKNARALIGESQRALEAVFPKNAIFTVTPEVIADTGARFFMAFAGNKALGCVALIHQGGYAEVKRLFTRPRARGKGVGRALMVAMERAAQCDGLHCLRLETGPELSAAVALYTAMGYTLRGPFGDYAAHPHSLFMEKPLT